MDIQKFSISRDDSIYEAWPDVTLTQSGILICIFTECKHHGDRSFSRLVYKKSTDRGRTWESKIALTEANEAELPYWNNARISRLKDNRLVIVADKIYGRDESNGINYLWFGDPEGRHWEGPIETPVTGIVPDKLCELPSGRWLMSAHDRSPAHGYLEQKLWYSDDQGQCWNGPVIVASQEGLNLCEVSILPLPDGTLTAFMRENSGQGWDCFKAISYDSGESWQGPYRVPIPGCHRPVSGLLQSGLIMITYRFMQGGQGWLGKWTQNFFAAVTDVESVKEVERNKQWTRLMPIDYDRSPVSDLGYSGWVQFDDGEIYVVNYIVDDSPNAQIRGYSLREDLFIFNDL